MTNTTPSTEEHQTQPMMGREYVLDIRKFPLLYVGRDPQHASYHAFARGDFARGETMRFLLIRDEKLSLAGNRVLDRSYAYTEISISPNDEKDETRRALIERALALHQEQQEAHHG